MQCKQTLCDYDDRKRYPVSVIHLLYLYTTKINNEIKQNDTRLKKYLKPYFSL